MISKILFKSDFLHSRIMYISCPNSAVEPRASQIKEGASTASLIEKQRRLWLFFWALFSRHLLHADVQAVFN
ncbi:MAG: hypothetical protein K9L59_13395 [Desulfobacterales bacterium]|nr:hypothetical protein [Desulfobacterales bacterium]